MNKPSQQMCEELLAVVFDMKHDIAAIAEEQGLTVAQFFTLMAIKRNGTMPMGSVAGLLHCDASNVTGIVDRLSLHKLIVRKESERDRREKILVLTPEGEAAIDHYLGLLPDRLGGGLLTDNEVTTLHAVFLKINQHN